MKLTDLDPRWIGFGTDHESRLGLTFECPHCRTQRIGVAFHRQGHEAIDDAAIIASNPEMSGRPIWTMTGTGFEDLTLTPSIDASAAGHWHGFVTAGEIR